MEVLSTCTVAPPRRQTIRKSRKWTVKEKKMIFDVLQKNGHQDLQNFAALLPHRTKSEIKRFLNKYRVSAQKKLSLKYDEEAKVALRSIHPWLPFLNDHCNSEPQLHENLVAFALPIIERFTKQPTPKENENVEFKLAYRSLFNSLLGMRFPEDTNHETFSMIFGSITQLFDDIRTERVDYNKVLSKCVKRYLERKNSEPNNANSKNSSVITQLQETNLLRFTEAECNKMCRKS